MTEDDPIDALLSAWHERFDRGEFVPATALCADRPELIPELERRIETLKAMATLARSLADERGPDRNGPIGPQRTRPSGSTPPTGARVPGYELIAQIGEGGMGTVYRARDERLKRLVALKVLRGGVAADPRHLDRFRAEAEAIARLQHPHIVQVFAVGEWSPPGEADALPYLALEYVNGGSLDKVFATGRLEPGEAARLVKTLAHAVQTAHAAGVIHRDLKPANVLLAPAVAGNSGSFAFGFPKVADFGLARLLGADQRQTLSGAVTGTPAYMAPEQAEGRADMGPAADVWALGVILYEALTGRVPFKGNSILATLDLIRRCPPQPPRELRSDVPADLEAICLRCLEKDPASRYPTAAALAEDLHRFASGGPDAPRPRAATDGSGRNRRGWAFVGGAVILAVLTGGLAAVWPHPDRESAAMLPRRDPPNSVPLKGSIDMVVYESSSTDLDRYEPGDPARRGIRLHERRALPLSPRDWIRIEAVMSRPAYLYIIWIDSDGKATPLWPWIDANWSRLPATQVPRDRLTLPETGGDIVPLTAGPPGIETILLLARDTPLDSHESQVLAATTGSLQRQPMAATDFAIWLENGERATDEPTRAPILSKAQSSGAPEVQVRSVMKQLHSTFPYTRAICFGKLGSP